MRGNEGSGQAIGAARRSLGRQLRALRIASGLSYEGLRVRGLPSRSTWNRIELGKAQIDMRTTAWACDVFEVDADRKKQLIELADVGARQTWFEEQNNKDLPTTPGLTMLLEMESFANRIMVWSPTFVPGLLQSPAYQHQTFSIVPGLTTKGAGRLADLRAKRQAETIGRANFSVVLDESVLLRQVGGAETMREQLNFLRALSARSDVEISVLPFAAGVHRGSRGEFTLMHFPSDTEEPPFYYGEGYRGVETSNDPEATGDIMGRFDGLLGKSVPLKEHIP